ncbi:PIN domain-containing protein [Fibrella forsythiae]|uniref:PIN domain-containing protein n=1 Tax=Fibrella forsythiae TaxID=2817061 RepID=A0ABS3JKW5_9BACT|nr:PIN domain-containing protein [Fibrella forsythiae]MBO0950649.1 PIN domain-containing protein [Fibrella forsythiae]
MLFYKKALLDNVKSLYASDITKLEVIGFHRLDENDKAYFEEFFSTIASLAITAELIGQSIRLRKRSLGDAIIAATALIHGLPVITNNVINFSAVDGLTVISLASILDGTAG